MQKTASYIAFRMSCLSRLHAAIKPFRHMGVSGFHWSTAKPPFKLTHYEQVNKLNVLNL